MSGAHTCWVRYASGDLVHRSTTNVSYSVGWYQRVVSPITGSRKLAYIGMLGVIACFSLSACTFMTSRWVNCDLCLRSPACALMWMAVKPPNFRRCLSSASDHANDATSRSVRFSQSRTHLCHPAIIERVHHLDVIQPQLGAPPAPSRTRPTQFCLTISPRLWAQGGPSR